MEFLHINADVADMCGEAFGVGEDEFLWRHIGERFGSFLLEQAGVGECSLKGVEWVLRSKIIDTARDVEAVGEDFYHFADVGDAAVFACGETEGRLCA